MIPRLVDSLSGLYLSDQFADVYFLVGLGSGSARVRVPAHRTLLAAHSEVFASMLYPPVAHLYCCPLSDSHARQAGADRKDFKTEWNEEDDIGSRDPCSFDS